MRKTVAVVGLGKIGIGYDLDPKNKWVLSQTMTHTKAVLESDSFELRYLVDNDLQKLKKIKKLLPNVVSGSLQKVLTLQPTNLVIIASSTSSHLEVINQISNNWVGCDYLIEKPVGNNSVEANKISILLGKSTSLVFVNYFRRFLLSYINFKDIGEFKSRGRLTNVKIESYGTLTNIFSHFLDLLVFLEGRDALGLSPKTVILNESSRKIFIINSSGVNFDLDGIGESKKNCAMTIKYEKITIQISDNGRLINIINQDNSLIYTTQIDSKLFSNYQSVVLKQINLIQNERTINSGLLDAIHIHKFIESVQ